MTIMLLPCACVRGATRAVEVPLAPLGIVRAARAPLAHRTGSVGTASYCAATSALVRQAM